VLDVKVLDYPCHAANLPVALVPNCAATRHCHFHLDGSGPARIEPPKLKTGPPSPGRRTSSRPPA
jgi:fumarate hydratase class I